MVTFVMLKYRVAEKSVFHIFHIFRISFIFRSFSALKKSAAYNNGKKLDTFEAAVTFFFFLPVTYLCLCYLLVI